MSPNITLGTAQFGLDYGISNATGKVSAGDIEMILIEAYSAGITTLDTAIDYGDSQKNIGIFLSKHQNLFKCISKSSKSSVTAFKEDFFNGLSELHQEKYEGYLIHHYQDYYNNTELWNFLQDQKKHSTVKKIGFSLYFLWELEDILARGLAVDIIQVPYNVFDRRFQKYFKLLQKNNIEVHCRSVFLQGLFFSNMSTLDPFFSSVKSKISQLQNLAKTSAIPLEALCLLFSLSTEGINSVLIGITSLEELQQNLDVQRYQSVFENVRTVLENLEEQNEQIMLPINWPK